MAQYDPSEDADKFADDEKKMPIAFDQMEAIREEQIKKQPLVSKMQPLSNLLEEFKDHPNFKRQIQAIIDAKTHESYRPMRQDGSCFYRAFLLALFESIENNQDSKLLASVNECAMSSLHRLLKFFYESFTIEDYYETFMDELSWLQKKINSNSSEYKAEDRMGDTSLQRLANEMHSHELIFWARMMTSLHIQENKDDFAPFIQGQSLMEFIKKFVEALHAEADHPQFVALSAVLRVPMRVYCLENIDKGGPQIVHSLGENNTPAFDLLFRPGHYDIIYRSQDYNSVIQQQASQTISSSNDNKNTNNNSNNATNNNINTNANANANTNAKDESNQNTDNNNSNNNNNNDNNNENSQLNSNQTNEVNESKENEIPNTNNNNNSSNNNNNDNVNNKPSNEKNKIKKPIDYNNGNDPIDYNNGNS